MAPARTINDLPSEVLVQLLADLRSDLPALVLVNKRFNNIYTPKLYEKFSYQWPSTVQYQMPMSEQDIQQIVVPQVVRRMQNFLRTIFTTPVLASHVKILKLHGRWLDEALQWLATRKHETGFRRIRRHLEFTRNQGSDGTALLLRILPNLERLDLDLNIRFFARDQSTKSSRQLERW